MILDYLKAYLKLALKYTKVTINSWWNIFVKAGSGIGKDSKQTTKKPALLQVLKSYI